MAARDLLIGATLALHDKAASFLPPGQWTEVANMNLHMNNRWQLILFSQGVYWALVLLRHPEWPLAVEIPLTVGVTLCLTFSAYKSAR